MSRCSTSRVVHGDMNHRAARIDGRSRDSLRHTGPHVRCRTAPCPRDHGDARAGRRARLRRPDGGAAGDTIGLIGPNGVGKTTLLSVLAGEIRPDRGTVEVTPPSATIGYLPQERHRGSELVRDYLHRRTGATGASAELDAASASLAAGDDGADTRYDVALTRWLSLGVADLPSRLARFGRS